MEEVTSSTAGGMRLATECENAAEEVRVDAAHYSFCLVHTIELL